MAHTVSESRHPNMKELRPRCGNIRVLFAFDPRRMAILLIGSDKTGRWREFYEEIIPVADDLYDEHLDELRKGRERYREREERLREAAGADRARPRAR